MKRQIAKTARGVALATMVALVFASVDFTVFSAADSDGNGTIEQGVITASADPAEPLTAAPEEGTVSQNLVPGEKSAGLSALLEKLPDPLTYLASGEADEDMIDPGQLDEAREALDEWLAENGADAMENNGTVSGGDGERLSELIERLEGLEHICDTETDCMDMECPYHYPEMIQQRMAENETPPILTLADLVEEYGVEMPAENAPIAVQTFAVQNAVTHPQTLMLTADNENNSHTGKADSDIDVLMSSKENTHPIELAFTLDELPAQSAYLAIKAYDVDEDGAETDYVYLNDDIYLTMDKTNSYGKKYNKETIGYLAGTNDTWNTTVLEIPVDKLKRGKNVISVTVAPGWVVRVDWMQLILDGGAAAPNIEEFSLDLKDAVTEDNLVTVQSHVTIRQKGTTQYITEYTLTQTETGNVLDACFGQAQETEEAALGMPLNSPSGVYKITGILKDPDTEAIKATDSVSFYFVQGTGPGPKVSHTLSPNVLTNQDVTITVSAEDMPDMGVIDVTASPGTMTVSKNGTYDFTIHYKLKDNNKSFTYQVKVDNIDKAAPKINYSPVTVLEDEAQETVKKLFAEAFSVSDNRKLADEPLSYTIPADVSSSPGTKTVTVTATDAAGNKSTESCTITVTAKPLELKLGGLTAVSGSKDKYSLKAVLTHTGADEIRETGFVWGIMPSPALEMNNGSAKTSPAVTTKNGNLSATATGLIAGVEYYARAYAKVTASDGSEKVIYSEAGKFGFGIPSYGTFSVSGVSNSGSSTTFTITRSGGSDGKQTVYYRTVNGSAIGGTHFTHKQGTVIFEDGEMSKTVSVTELGVTKAYNNDVGTQYSNADRTYSLEIYRVEGGGAIDGGKRSGTRTMTKSLGYAIDRTIYTQEKSITHVADTDGTKGKQVADTTGKQSGKTTNVSFLKNRYDGTNYNTSSFLQYYTDPYQQKYLNATAGGWYYRYVLRSYEDVDGYEHAYMGTLTLEDKNYDISKEDAAVTGVNGQLWACNFLQGARNREGTYNFPNTRTGGGENAYYPKNSSGTTYSYNGKTWVNLRMDDTCYAYFGATGDGVDVWYVDGLTSYAMVQDEKEPVLLGVAPMADGTYLPGDPITVALVFDEIVDNQNSSLSGLTITTNVGTLTYAGGADTNVLYFTGTVSANTSLGGNKTLQVTGISNVAGIKDMCSLSGTSQTFPGGNTNVAVDATKPTATITADTSGSNTVTTANGTASLKVTENGTYTVTLTDGCGSEISKSIEVQKIDARKPTVTIRSGSSTAEDTVYPELTLAVLPEDTGGSGVAKVEYAWTNDTAEPSSWTSLTAGADGSYQAEYTATETAKTAKYLQVRVADGAENVSTVIRSGPYYMMKPATGNGLPTITVTGNPTVWGKSAVLTWTAKKGTGSGAGEIASVYTPDGTQTGDLISDVTTGTSKVTKNGIYVFRVTDQYGNSGSAEVLVTTIDNEAPKLEKLECSLSADKKTGTIRLTDATDDCTAVYDNKGNRTGYSGSGIQTGQYRLEGENTWTTFTGDSFTVTENGKYVVRLEDRLGNISKEYSVEMKDIFKDTQKPSLTAAVESGAGANTDGRYHATVLHISLSYSDNVGTEKLYGKADEGNFAEISGISTEPGTTFTKTYDCVEGVHTYIFKAEDAAGNETVSAPVTVKWDKTKPVIGEITFEQKAANIFDWIIGKKSLILHIPVTEEGSGADEVTYTVTPASGTAKNAAARIEEGVAEIVLSADWKGSITDIKCTDAAGNASDTKSITGAANGIIVEDNPPEITFSVNGSTALAEEYEEVPAIAVSVKDAGENAVSAGLASVAYRVNNGAENTLQEELDINLKTEAGFTIPAEKFPSDAEEITIAVRATDNAGNQSEKSLTIRIHTGGTIVDPPKPSEPPKPAETPKSSEPPKLTETPKESSERLEPTDPPKPSASPKPTPGTPAPEAGQTVEEPTSTDHGKDMTVGGTEENHKCGLCHICPTFLGICCFVWLAVILAAVLSIWIVLRRNRREKEEREES